LRRGKVNKEGKIPSPGHSSENHLGKKSEAASHPAQNSKNLIFKKVQTIFTIPSKSYIR
jgi:hypothetical protein